MSRLDELIAELCPDGVPRKHIWELTTWDKKFKGVVRSKQPQTKKYRYLLAKELKDIATESGDVKLLFTGANDKDFTTEEKAADYISEGEIVAIPWGGTPSVQYYKGKFVTSDNRIATSNDIEILDNKFLFYWMLNNIELIGSYYRGPGIQHPDMSKVLDTIIPVPPLPVQKEIVRILDKFTELEAQLDAELQAREKQYAHYRDALLDFSPDKPRIGSKHSRLNKLIETLCPDGVEYIQLRCVFDIFNGYTPSKSNATYWEEGTIPWFRMEDIRKHGRILNDSIQHVDPKAVKGELFPANSLIIATSATIGEHALITVDALTNQRFTCLSPKKEYQSSLIPKFIFYYGFILDKWCLNNVNTSSFASVDMEKFGNFEIPIPPLPVQKEIVRILDKFDTLVNDVRQGLPAEISARHAQYEYYRDKLLTFKEKPA